MKVCFPAQSIAHVHKLMEVLGVRWTGLGGTGRLVDLHARQFMRCLICCVLLLWGLFVLTLGVGSPLFVSRRRLGWYRRRHYLVSMQKRWRNLGARPYSDVCR